MLKVLIVEGDDVLRRDIAEILEYEGFFPLEANNGWMGLQLAKQYPPDLILMDVVMPYMNRYEAFLTLLNHSMTAAIPLIMMTAYTEQELVQQGVYLEGVQITKPFEISGLISIIHQFNTRV